MGKKISFKPTDEVRTIEQKIDDWVMADTSAEIKTVVQEKSTQETLTKLTINMPSDLHKKLKLFCAQEQITMRDKIIDTLKQALITKNS